MDIRSKVIWMDGKLVPFESANVHILTHTLHYGLGVFEGIRCYQTHDGKSAIFRLGEHVQRLMDSAHVVMMPMPYTREQIESACVDTIRANGFSSCYIRPLAFMGDGAMGLGAMTNATRLSIITWQWGAYLGEEGLEKGIRAKVSSFNRPGINMMMSKAKVVGHYVNSIMAKREALAAGYQEAVMLDAQGYVAEASGENLFMVKDGKVFTPGVGASILSGITRDTIKHIVAHLGLELHERPITRDELYLADEIFLSGTAAEITPVRELDNRAIGAGTRGPITATIQKTFFDVVKGKALQEKGWLTVV